MREKKTVRGSGNYPRTKTSTPVDAHILAHDVLLGVAGAFVMVGIPLLMAVLKQMGAW